MYFDRRSLLLMLPLGAALVGGIGVWAALERSQDTGYDPRAALSLWQKMEAASKGAPPAFLSDHPSNPDRLRTIAANIPRVQGLYDRAPKPDVRYGPPMSGGNSGKG